jgi:hypothetical protein
MTKTQTTGISERFCGKSKSNAVKESLLKQPMVAGNETLART